MQKTSKTQLGRIQRMACLAITGAMKSIPTAAMEILLNLTPLDLVILAEARMTLYRLHILKQPADPKAEAASLSTWKNASGPILDMRADHTIPVYHSKIFKVIIDWDYWRYKDPLFPEDALIWFTDGSRANSRTGSGIFGLRPNRSFSLPLDKFATVFQTEIYAILQCPCENKTDKLARQASAMPLLSPEPALGIPKCSIREAIKNWTEMQHHRAWEDLPGLRHGKLFTGRPCKKRADDLLKLSRHQLKMVTAIFTGHAHVRGHLYIMGLFDGDPICRFCGMETETVQHIICCCEALARQRYNVFWKLTVKPRHKHSFSKGPLPLHTRHRVIESVLNKAFRTAQ